jgi:citrate lyase subunit beta/citryl-CoA lyase
MTFGEQVDTDLAHRVMDRALERGVDFFDTAEMYAVPARPETYGATETIIGQWFASRPGARQRVVLATKVAGPSRGMPWIRGDHSGLSRAEIVSACEGSLRRLQTDVIDLYQLHWPARNVPTFGARQFDPARDVRCATVQEQLEAMAVLVRDGKVRAVRVNDWTTQWTYADVVEIVEGAGPNLDCIMLPKVQTAEQVVALDLLLTQLEKSNGFEPGRIGIEAQIENAMGLINVDAIAGASPRVETIIFGPADFMASINMKSLVVGEQPPGYDVGDAYHYILMRILMAARAHDKLAIDGPYLAIKDVDGYRRVASRSAALGFDGKWVLHPGQVDAANEVYSPRQEDYDHAELILDAYAYYTSAEGGAKGAVMLGDEMIDEASRKMAMVIAAKGRAAGMSRTQAFTPPA